jgi:H+/Cl- antiporter ClcA
MPEASRVHRTAPIVNVLLTTAIVVSAVALAVAIVIAVLVDIQSDFLGTQSEQSGGFDPSVFPPWNGALWLIGNMFPVLLAVLLAILIVARIIAGPSRERDRTVDGDPVASRPSTEG